VGLGEDGNGSALVDCFLEDDIHTICDATLVCWFEFSFSILAVFAPLPPAAAVLATASPGRLSVVHWKNILAKGGLPWR